MKPIETGYTASDQAKPPRVMIFVAFNQLACTVISFFTYSQFYRPRHVWSLSLERNPYIKATTARYMCGE